MSKAAAAPKQDLDAILATLSTEDLDRARLDCRAAIVTLEEGLVSSHARILNLRAAITKIEALLRQGAVQ